MNKCGLGRTITFDPGVEGQKMLSGLLFSIGSKSFYEFKNALTEEKLGKVPVCACL